MTSAPTRTLISSMTVSLDGYVAARDGDIDFGAPEPDRFTVNVAQIGELSTYFLGRRLYETMLPLETDPAMRATPEHAAFCDIWAALPKVVFSRTLDHVHGNARLATGTIEQELERAPHGIVSVGGADLIAQCVDRDLIDEYRLYVVPVVLGGGTPYFPQRDERLDLELLETRAFERTVYLRYGRARPGD